MTAARSRCKVALIVDGCSDSDTDPKPPWHERKEAYISHLAEAPLAVLRVFAADKLHNARAILSDYRVVGERLGERFAADRTQLLWYYRYLVEAFRRAARRAGPCHDRVGADGRGVIGLVLGPPCFDGFSKARSGQMLGARPQDQPD
jgi:hypothetical protein